MQAPQPAGAGEADCAQAGPGQAQAPAAGPCSTQADSASGHSAEPQATCRHPSPQVLEKLEALKQGLGKPKHLLQGPALAVAQHKGHRIADHN